MITVLPEPFEIYLYFLNPKKTQHTSEQNKQAHPSLPLHPSPIIIHFSPPPRCSTERMNVAAHRHAGAALLRVSSVFILSHHPPSSFTLHLCFLRVMWYGGWVLALVLKIACFQEGMFSSDADSHHLLIWVFCFIFFFHDEYLSSRTFSDSSVISTANMEMSDAQKI